MFRPFAMALMLVGLCGIGVEPAAAQEKIPEPLPKEIVAAWEKARAQTGWLEKSVFGERDFRLGGKGKAGEIPAFKFDSIPWVGKLRELPAPGQAFGLDFSHNVIDSGFNELAGLKHLQALNIQNNQVTVAGLKGLSALVQLQTLDLSLNFITDANLKELATLKQLKELNLGFNGITDAGLKELTGMKQLKELNLGFNGITDAGLKELTGMKQLLMLDLSRTKVTDSGLKELAAMKQLLTLGLYGTKVTDAGLKELQKALPACQIIR